METGKEQNVMMNMKVPRAVALMAIPSVVSNLVTVVYNLADTFFVGRTGDALQVAAVSLTNPIFIFLMAFANILGLGGSAAISVAMGKQDEQRAKKVSSFVTYMSLILGIAVMLILLLGMNPILTLFGANEETYLLAKGYTQYIAIGAPFIIWSAAASFIVRSEGASREAMIGNMIGTFTNIILDPILISGCGLGAGGAAMATTIGNILACIYYLWYFLKRSKALSIKPSRFTVKEGIFAETVSCGMPAGLQSILMTVSTIIMNQILVEYGNDPVAAIGIVFKANMFIAFLQMGIANGVQPLLGYNYGAYNQKRYMDIVKFTRLCCVIAGVASTLLYILARGPIIHAFINDEAVIAYGVKMLFAYSLSGPFLGLLFVNINCLQTTGKANLATLLAAFRQGVILIPVIFLFQAIWKMNGVIYAQSVTDIITVILSIIIWAALKEKVWKNC